MKLDEIIDDVDKELYKHQNFEGIGHRPKELFRYCSVHEIDRLLQYAIAKTSPRIFLSNPLYFNDPYDSWMPGVRLDKIPITLENVTKNLSKIGVTSLSSIHDSILMWSHYADNHKGICLEYSTIDIEDMLNKNKDAYLVKVIYLKDNSVSRYKLGHPVNMSYEANGLYDFFEMVSGKEKSWSYEKEWRIVRRLNNKMCGDYNRRRYVKLSPKKIYLGVEASEKDKAKIRYISKYMHIPVEQMKIDEKDYQLGSVPFETKLK